jgi:ketosteroid isomerase-like protein
MAGQEETRMSTEQNKQLVAEFFGRFNDRDLAGALGMLADDVNWWISGKPEAQPAAGPHDKAQITALLQNMGRRLKNGLAMTVKGMIAEGDRVAVELESHGELENGRVYNNEYHMLITIRDGRIAEIREYLDTQHVVATWFQE